MKNIPDARQREPETEPISHQTYRSRINVIAPQWITKPEKNARDKTKSGKLGRINFSLKPEELEAYLNEYVIKQEDAKSILATKVCTHFNRIRHFLEQGREPEPGVGAIKNNIILAGTHRQKDRGTLR
jgi:ATP-dependent protease Clp ATPase subunit